MGWRKGPWAPEEDKLLTDYVTLNGEGRWSCVSRSSGLNRTGKSCRLRWVNYLRPGLKKGKITPLEEGIIIEMHALWGNKWSTIARYLPGRTDNEIKNYWRTHFKKKAKARTKNQEKRKIQSVFQQQKVSHDINYKVLPLEEAVDDKSTRGAEGNQLLETIFTCPITMEDLCLPLMDEEQDVVSWSDNNMIEDDLWGGLWLWNLDDQPHGWGAPGTGQVSQASKINSMRFFYGGRGTTIDF